ncbi:MAG: hypothetical protein Q8Q30_02045 [Candidatus Woesebacteria bacterium]|nr:hypothetical protein [Candidatus Woesebacteria bacterium]
MDKFFSIFGKVMLVVIILTAMIYGGYYFGKKASNEAKPEAVSTEFASPSPVPSTYPLVTVVGGVSKSAGLSFDQYSITAPEEWIAKKESQTVTDERLILTKGEYQINIFQAATGGALCLYPGDADFEGPSSRFEFFKDLTSEDNRTLRRSWNTNDLGFTVCQKGQDGSYIQPTNYGHISISVPDAQDNKVLEEIDSIISSLKKI